MCNTNGSFLESLQLIWDTLVKKCYGAEMKKSHVRFNLQKWLCSSDSDAGRVCSRCIRYFVCVCTFCWSFSQQTGIPFMLIFFSDAYTVYINLGRPLFSRMEELPCDLFIDTFHVVLYRTFSLSSDFSFERQWCDQWPWMLIWMKSEALWNVCELIVTLYSQCVCMCCLRVCLFQFKWGRRIWVSLGVFAFTQLSKTPFLGKMKTKLIYSEKDTFYTYGYITDIFFLRFQISFAFA